MSDHDCADEAAFQAKRAAAWERRADELRAALAESLADLARATAWGEAWQQQALEVERFADDSERKRNELRNRIMDAMIALEGANAP